jgi:hypothetical protein
MTGDAGNYLAFSPPVKPFKNLIMMGIILPFKNLTLAMALARAFFRS